MITPAQYERHLQTEHELINRRLTWLLTSQSILFAALAFVLGKDIDPVQQKAFLLVVPMLALVISLSILIGVIMAIIAKFTIWKQYKKEQILPDLPLGVSTRITRIALIPDLFIPIAFIAAWLCLLFFPRHKMNPSTGSSLH